MKESEYSVNLAKYGVVKNSKWELAILPWGATEPHGQHLPYGSDNLLAEAIACDAAGLATEQGVNVMVLPAVPFGQQNRGQVELPFCINASLETMRCILADVVESLQRQGIGRLLIMIGHGGDTYALKAIIRDFSVRYPNFDIATCEYYTLADRRHYFDAEIDDHAGEEETSLMLHYYPELVRMDLAGDGALTPFAIDGLNDKTAWLPRVWDKASSDTGIGDPHLASAKKGEAFLAAILPRITRLIVDFASKSLY